MPAMTRVEPAAKIMQQFPNMPRNINRDNASRAIKEAVAAYSHTFPAIEALNTGTEADRKRAHDMRQVIRDEVFARMHALKNA